MPRVPAVLLLTRLRTTTLLVAEWGGCACSQLHAANELLCRCRGACMLLLLLLRTGVCCCCCVCTDKVVVLHLQQQWLLTAGCAATARTAICRAVPLLRAQRSAGVAAATAFAVCALGGGGGIFDGVNKEDALVTLNKVLDALILHKCAGNPKTRSNVTHSQAAAASSIVDKRLASSLVWRKL